MPGLLQRAPLIVGPGTSSDPNASHDTLTGTDWSAPLNRENRLPGQEYFDTSVNDNLIPQQTGHNFEAQLGYGVGKDDLGGTGGAGFAAGNDPMAQALSARYEDQASNTVRGVLAGNKERGEVMQSGAENAVSHELAAERQNDVQNFNAQYAYQVQRQNLLNQYQSAKAQAEAGLYGAVFGGIASIGGAVLGGRKGGK